MRYINDIIGKGNIGVFKNKKGQSIKQMLLEQAKYLQELINKSLKDYRRNFNPEKYKRTGSLENSVVVSSKVKIVNGKLTAYVYFNENTALLINNGYTVTKPVWFADIPNFGIRKGNQFVEKAVDEFNKTNSMGIYIDKSDIIKVREW